MKKSLDQVLSIRKKLEQKAEIRLGKLNAQLSQCENERLRTEIAINDYRIWRIEEEAQLFNNLKGATIQLKDLHNYQASYTELDRQEQELINSISQLDIQKEALLVEIGEAKTQLSLARKAKEKVEHMVSVRDQETQMLNERAEENDLDEFNSNSFARKLLQKS